MKTLDEVIAALEDEGVFPDALHYLKAYRENQRTYEESSRKAEEARERYLEAVRNCEEAENKYKQMREELGAQKLHMMWVDKHFKFEEPNEPLDWETLKHMEGKPVWITYEDCKGGWVIVGKSFSLFENDEPDAYIYMYYLKNKIECSKELYGSYWKAYRKERE